MGKPMSLNLPVAGNRVLFFGEFCPSVPLWLRPFPPPHYFFLRSLTEHWLTCGGANWALAHVHGIKIPLLLVRFLKHTYVPHWNRSLSHTARVHTPVYQGGPSTSQSTNPIRSQDLRGHACLSRGYFWFTNINCAMGTLFLFNLVAKLGPNFYLKVCDLYCIPQIH